MTKMTKDSAIQYAVNVLEENPILSSSETRDLLDVLKPWLPQSPSKGMLVFKSIGPERTTITALHHTPALVKYIEDFSALTVSDELLLEIMNTVKLNRFEIEQMLDVALHAQDLREETLVHQYKIALLARIGLNVCFFQATGRETMTVATGNDNYDISEIVTFLPRSNWPAGIGYSKLWEHLGPQRNSAADSWTYRD